MQRLAGSASGEQPAGTGVGGGLQVVALGGGLQQQGGERLGHRGGWLPEADEDLPVGGVGDVVDGQADDAGGWLGEQQRDTARLRACIEVFEEANQAYEGFSS